jgi:pimeloyl-ACP methyl ester carboxylesterase
MGTGAQPPLHEPLAASPVPLLFLAGADDGKFRAIAEDLRHRLPGADADVVPDAGHAAHLENPDAVTRLARRHFTRHGGRAAAATTQPQPMESIA